MNKILYFEEFALKIVNIVFYQGTYFNFVQVYINGTRTFIMVIFPSTQPHQHRHNIILKYLPYFFLCSHLVQTRNEEQSQ